MQARPSSSRVNTAGRSVSTQDDARGNETKKEIIRLHGDKDGTAIATQFAIEANQDIIAALQADNRSLSAELAQRRKVLTSKL